MRVVGSREAMRGCDVVTVVVVAVLVSLAVPTVTAADAEAPSAPRNLEAEPGPDADAITLSWDEPEHAGGWNEDPAGDGAGSLRDVWGSATDDIWAVGSKDHDGRFLHYDGNLWTTDPASGEVSTSYFGVWGTASDDVWAVGTTGKIQHYDGTTWSLEPDDSDRRELYDVWGSGPFDVWAVGWEGGIWHYDGSSWSEDAASGTPNHLRALSGTSSSDVWAVGWEGEIWHYDGSSWSEDPASGSPDNHLSDVWAVSSSDVWAVGWEGEIWHYDGSSWSEHPASERPEDLNGLWASGGEDVWAVAGSGETWRYDGDSWSGGQEEGSPLLRALWGAASDDLWAVGWDEIWHSNGPPVESYHVHRSRSEEGPHDHVGTVSAPTTEFTDTGLEEETTYHYVVSAESDLREGPLSGEVNETTFTTPSEPRNLEALPGPDPGEISLDWNRPADDGGPQTDEYRIYRSTSEGGPYDVIHAVDGSQTSYTDDGRELGQTYYYVVTAVNIVGEGPQSNEAWAPAVASPVDEAHASCQPIPPLPGDESTCEARLQVLGNTLVDEEESVSIPAGAGNDGVNESEERSATSPPVPVSLPAACPTEVDPCREETTTPEVDEQVTVPGIRIPEQVPEQRTCLPAIVCIEPVPVPLVGGEQVTEEQTHDIYVPPKTLASLCSIEDQLCNSTDEEVGPVQARVSVEAHGFALTVNLSSVGETERVDPIEVGPVEVCPEDNPCSVPREPTAGFAGGNVTVGTAVGDAEANETVPVPGVES